MNEDSRKTTVGREKRQRCEVLEEKLERSMAEANMMQGHIMQMSPAI